MITVATKKNDSGWASQVCPLYWSKPIWTRSQLMTPVRQSNSHFQTVTAATSGMAQASSSDTCSTTRTTGCTAFISSASSVPMPTVANALTRQKTTERTTTAHIRSSLKIRA